MIKAIETAYNGYRFRSRLEARWAVFFDVLGIQYEYEPEGFDLGDAGWYLPDFWIPELNMWVEVKPWKEEPRWPVFWDLTNAYAKSYRLGTEGNAPVIVARGTPPGRGNFFFANDVTDSGTGGSYSVSGVQLVICKLCGFLTLHNPEDGRYQSGSRSIYTGQWSLWEPACRCLPNEQSILVPQSAHETSRQARFEHGANGWARA